MTRFFLLLRSTLLRHHHHLLCLVLRCFEVLGMRGLEWCAWNVGECYWLSSHTSGSSRSSMGLIVCFSHLLLLIKHVTASTRRWEGVVWLQGTRDNLERELSFFLPVIKGWSLFILLFMFKLFSYEHYYLYSSAKLSVHNGCLSLDLTIAMRWRKVVKLVLRPDHRL